MKQADSNTIQPDEAIKTPVRLKYSNRGWFQIGDDGEDLGMIAHAFPNPTVDEGMHHYIVHAVNEYPRLSAENEQLKAEVERLKAALEHYADLNNWSNADRTFFNDDFISNEYDWERNGWEVAAEALSEK